MRASRVLGVVAGLAIASVAAGCSIALHGTPAQPAPATTTWHVSWPAMHVTLGPEVLATQRAAANAHLADARTALDACRAARGGATTEPSGTGTTDPCSAEQRAVRLAQAETLIADQVSSPAPGTSVGIYELICGDGSFVSPEDGYAACPDEARS